MTAAATIGIVDYGMGNLRSVAGAVERLGHRPQITAQARDLAACDKLILPGVGAFPDAMANLAARGLAAALDDLVRGVGKPLLGICLGAQLVCLDSDEHALTPGLGWLPARVRRMRPADALAVPHVGWNDLVQVRPSRLFDGLPAGALMYYVHSHAILAEDAAVVAGTCDYGGLFAAVLEQGNIAAAQFHPEKSQRHGLRLLQNFIERF